MSKLEIALKQHTPIIHFQHNEEGATLRATELKPKLDKFIITQIGEGCYKRGKERLREDMLYVGWLIGKPQNDNDPHALNYKVKVEYTGTPNEYFIISGQKPNRPNINERDNEEQRNKKEIKKKKADLINNIQNIPNIIHSSPYFAQENYEYLFDVNEQTNQVEFLREKWNDCTAHKTKGLCAKAGESIIITFFSLNGSIIADGILKNIRSFFISTNFGTRQSKGFGCFTVDVDNLHNKLNGVVLSVMSNEKAKIENDDNEQLLEKNFDFVYKNENIYADFIRIFSKIKSDYMLLKSGTNYPQYAKSKLFKYGVSKSLRWEKRFIKKINCKRIVHDIIGKKTKYVKVQLKENKAPVFGAGENDCSHNDAEKYNYVFLRALLGLTERYEFLLSDNSKKLFVFPKHIYKNESEKIERIPSPLLFKVIDNHIYIVGNRFNSAILGATFKFTTKREDAPVKPENMTTIEYLYTNQLPVKKLSDKELPIRELKIPDNLDLGDFMEYAMAEKELNYTPLKNH